jgi:hypothetical protein
MGVYSQIWLSLLYRSFNLVFKNVYLCNERALQQILRFDSQRKGPCRYEISKRAERRRRFAYKNMIVSAKVPGVIKCLMCRKHDVLYIVMAGSQEVFIM